MFRRQVTAYSSAASFPRARGDVPPEKMPEFFGAEFSPRTRGCSAQLLAELPLSMVFPAHAGMFRCVKPCNLLRSGFPRARGDVPRCSNAPSALLGFSPRTRGCSLYRGCAGWGDGVFPAHAGMFRYHLGMVVRDNPFSPRTRGCSSPNSDVVDFTGVFPAHAGMFPAATTSWRSTPCFPRARGDVPLWDLGLAVGEGFSPRTRGCSSVGSRTCSRGRVFPAHAGMFRQLIIGWGIQSSFPRARGDVPHNTTTPATRRQFSPRTRGCS